MFETSRIASLKSKFHRLRATCRLLTPFDALRVAFWNVLHRQTLLRVRIAGIKIVIRTATPDLDVAFSSLLFGEYDDIELENVSVIVDGGANIGTSAIAFARKYPNALVIAIEPEAENFKILQENVKSWPNVQPLCAAIAKDDNERPLFNRGTGPWGYTITTSSQTIAELGQTVTCLTVDGIMDRFALHSIDILKLDIEGGEKEVLEQPGLWIEDVRLLIAELHERITPGCELAFDRATRSFRRRVRLGEKVIAYR